MRSTNAPLSMILGATCSPHSSRRFLLTFVSGGRVLLVCLVALDNCLSSCAAVIFPVETHLLPSKVRHFCALAEGGEKLPSGELNISESCLTSLPVIRLCTGGFSSFGVVLFFCTSPFLLLLLPSIFGRESLPSGLRFLVL